LPGLGGRNSVSDVEFLPYPHRMPLVVDAYNVLHVTGVLPPDLAGLEVDGLGELIARSRYARDDAVLVCDGSPPRTPRLSRTGRIREEGGHHAAGSGRGGVEIRYAGRGRDADAAIEEMIARSSAPKRLLVVSSDGRIVRAARRRRCRTSSAEAFLRRLVADWSLQATARGGRGAPSARPRVPLSKAETERWARIFGLDEETLAIPSSASKRRALEDARSLDEIDAAALESFDMREWIGDDEE
jgi:hypothetical protein